MNFRPVRFQLPPTYKLWPDIAQSVELRAPKVEIPARPMSPWQSAFPATQTAFPETPPIPPTVATGDLITAVHENTVTEGISDLWVDLQWLAANSLTNPTTTKGDLLVSDGSTVVRVPVGANAQVLTADSTLPLGVKWTTPTVTGSYVPTSRQVIAGAGMTGGGALTADVTLNAKVTSVFGRTGDVVLGAGDITTAGGVPATRQVIAGTGMTGGGALSANVTLNANVVSVFGRTGAVVLTNADIVTAGGVSTSGAYADPAWITSLGWSKITSAPATFPPSAHTHDASAIVSGVIAPARLGTGTPSASVYLRGDGTWAAVASGGGGSQTPWTSHIDAAGFNLGSVGYLGIGAAATTAARIYTVLGTLPGTAGATLVSTMAYALSNNYDELSAALIRDTASTDWTAATWRIARKIDTTANVASIDFGPYLVGFNVQGTRKVTVSANGLGVGINLQPASILHLMQSVSGGVGPVLTLENSTGALHDAVSIKFVDGGLRSELRMSVDAPYGGDLIYFSGGAGTTEIFRAASNGNFGINQVTPRARLDVVGLNAAPAASGDQIGAILCSYGYGGPGLNLGVQSAYAWIQSAYTNNAGTTQPLALQPVGGNVGIGNTAPAYKLDCNGTMGFQSQLFGNGKVVVTTNDTYLRLNESSQFANGVWLGTSFVGMSSNMLSIGSVGGAGCIQLSATSADAVTRIVLNGNANADCYFATGGKVGIGAPPQNLLAVIAASNPTTVATANQIAVGEITNNAAYRMAMGFGTVSNGQWAGVLQTTPVGSVPLLINASGNVVAIGCTVPQATVLALNPIAGNASSVATCKTLTVGETTNTPGYYLGMGMFHDGTNWNHSIQATSGGAPGILMLNGQGGGVRVGSAAAPGFALDVTGDVNVSGAFRVNGAPISTGGSGFTNQNIVTGAAIGTSYQNTSSKTLMVSVTIQMNPGDSVRSEVGPTNPPTNIAGHAYSSSGSGYQHLTWMVLNGQYYRLNRMAGTSTIVYWTEWY